VVAAERLEDAAGAMDVVDMSGAGGDSGCGVKSLVPCRRVFDDADGDGEGSGEQINGGEYKKSKTEEGGHTRYQSSYQSYLPYQSSATATAAVAAAMTAAVALAGGDAAAVQTVWEAERRACARLVVRQQTAVQKYLWECCAVQAAAVARAKATTRANTSLTASSPSTVPKTRTGDEDINFEDL
jgi:hypothetical protein